MPKQIRQRILSETVISGGRRLDLELREADEAIPGALILPDRAAPAAGVPAALLLHGYSADKEMMAGTIGRALAQRGIASLSLDLPLHGVRRTGGARPSPGSAMELVKHWRAAVAEGTLGLSYLGARPEIDGKRLSAVGYSLGSFVCGAIAATDPRVRALVIAAGGDLPPGPLATFARPLMDPWKRRKTTKIHPCRWR